MIIPTSATLDMTNEHVYYGSVLDIIVVIERDLGLCIYLINNLPARDTDDYKFISYGMRLLEIREHIKKLIDEYSEMLKHNNYYQYLKHYYT